MLHVIAVAAVILVTALIVLNLAYHTGTLEVFSLYITGKWFGAVMQELSPGSRLLDIGCGISWIKSFGELLASGVTLDTLIGTGRLLSVAKIKVVGIEGDDKMFKQAAATLKRAGLLDDMILHNKSICDGHILQVFTAVNRFNVVCFSSSVMAQPDPVAALRVAASLLKEGGVVYLPLVVNYPSKLSSLLSPLFKLLHLFPIADVKKVVLEADMEVINDLPAVGDDGKDKKPTAARILVLQRRNLSTASHGDNSNLRSRKSVESEA